MIHSCIVSTFFNIFILHVLVMVWDLVSLFPVLFWSSVIMLHVLLFMSSMCVFPALFAPNVLYCLSPLCNVAFVFPFLCQCICSIILCVPVSPFTLCVSGFWFPIPHIIIGLYFAFAFFFVCFCSLVISSLFFLHFAATFLDSEFDALCY